MTKELFGRTSSGWLRAVPMMMIVNGQPHTARPRRVSRGPPRSGARTLRRRDRTAGFGCAADAV